MHGFADYFTVGIWIANAVFMPFMVGRKREPPTPAVATLAAILYGLFAWVAYVAVTS